jgi:Mg/Co/Ni transporter MgtE
MNTRDRDEILISTVIKLIKRKAIPSLKNVIAKTHSADIAPWFPRLRPEEQIILFDLLIQEGRMGEVLNELNSEERDFLIETTVAQVVARYNLLAVPVLDDTDGLVGIVTIDDVVDLIREENTEDVLKMAGTGDVDIASKSVLRNTRARRPWLLASFVGGLIAVYMIGQFEEPLEKITALAFFIPIIMGMGGNIGTQSSTIIVRGLVTGEVDLKEAWKVL